MTPLFRVFFNAIFCIAVLILSISCSHKLKTTGNTSKNNLANPVLATYAHFPGGNDSLQFFLKNGLKKTIQKASLLGVKGSILVYFIIEKDGTVSNIRLEKKLTNCTSCNEDVLALIKNMPKWIPGTVDGKPVRLQNTLPIRFDFK